VAAPRLFVYAVYAAGGAPRTAEAARQRVRDLKAQGVDGLKMFAMDRDLMAAAWDEARKTTCASRIMRRCRDERLGRHRFGTTSIEHWYGIPDAAIETGVQNFPPSYNYNDEVDRFRYAGRLWREANWDRLMKVLDAMAEARVAWDTTLVIYEASRDLQRAQTQPWFAEYCTRRSKNTFAPTRRITARTSSAGLRRTRRCGRRTIASGWLPCASLNGAAASSAWAKTRASSIRCTASVCCANWSCIRRRAFIR
jgi:hypothetical protein